MKFLIMLCMGSLFADLPLIFTSGSYLLWIPNQDGLDIAYSIKTPTQRYSPSTGFSQGFKASLGVSSGRVSLISEYSWYKNDAATALYKNSREIYPTWGYMGGERFTQNPITDVGLSTLWNVYYQEALVYLSRKADFCNGYIDFIGGILSAWDIQHFSVIYNTNDTTYKWTSLQKWFGVGPYGGISQEYSLIEILGTNLLARLHMAISLPLYDRDTNMVYSKDYSILDDHWGISTLLHGILGISWRGNPWFYHEVYAAWEGRVILDHNHFFSPLSYTLGSGLYSLSGLSLSLSIGY